MFVGKCECGSIDFAGNGPPYGETGYQFTCNKCGKVYFDKEEKKSEEAVIYDKKIANKIVSQVLKRLEVGSKKYGAEYFLADCIGDELYQELLDQVGWALINAVRWVEVFQKRFLPTDAIYWKKFMSIQKKEFLLKLRQEVDEELTKRGEK